MKPLVIETTNPVDLEIIARHAERIRKRASIEIAVVRRLVEILAAEGYHFTVDDGEDETKTDDPDEIVQTIFGVDEAYLYCRADDGRPYSQVFLVMGNDGWDVIADYGMSLAPILDPFLDWLEEEQNKQ